jgi:EF-P beta-lysylation protein EpmB
MIARSPVVSQPFNWRKSLREAFRDPAELLATLDLPPSLVSSSVNDSFRFLVTRQFASRMVRGQVDDPLLLQVLPRASESRHDAGFLKDPVGDLESRKTTGLLHKYHGRVLLITTGACAIHCRYCFRRHFPYSEETAARAHWHEALDYIKNDESISEVILSGGDPLLLDTRRLAELGEQLENIAHIRRLRIHSRLPVVLPERINPTLLDWLDGLSLQKVMVIHCNHERELDCHTDRSINELHHAGVTLLNQSVLLAGVNASSKSLIDLSERLFESGVLPYYLHLLDPVQGAAHFHVDNQKARKLAEQMRIRLPGYLVPRLVQELPGKPYKLPLL